MKSIRWLLAGGLFVSLFIAASHAQTTAEVYSVSFSASGLTEGEPDPDPTVEKLKITQNHIINLALGRDVEAPVAANEVMALVLPADDGEISLVVFDTNTTSILATIAGSQEVDGLDTAKGGFVVIAFDVRNVGVPENRLIDGKIYCSIAFAQVDDGEVTKLKSSLIGVLEVTVDSEDGTVLITKGKLARTGRIGVIVTGPM